MSGSAKGERLMVAVGSGNGGFNATVWLASGDGEAAWNGSPIAAWVEYYRTHHRQVRFTLSDDGLDKLRQLASEMRERGPYTYRDQFAQAGIGFTWVGADATVEWRYEVDGGLPGEADGPYDVVAEAVWAAIDAQCAEERASGSLFPAVKNDAELMPLHRQSEPWLPATRRVASLHRLGGEAWARASDGSHIVMLSEQIALKFYVPFWPDAVENEETVLWHLRYEDLPIEIPKIRARGELDGWEYLAVTRVEGTPLRDVNLSDDEALEVARALGTAIRSLHDIKVPKDSPLREIVPKWRPFLTANRKDRHEHELKRGTSEAWADRLVDHLRSWRYRKRPTNTLLHADLTDEHITLQQVDGRWQLTGIIDFGDVKVGDPAYDFAAPFAFWTADRPDLRRAILDGYGAGEELLDRIFESLLLHEYGALGALNLEGLDTIADIRRRYIELEP